MLITRCPHCQTTFRVRSEQLHLRGGRVRCGTCQTPFSALQSLEELPDGAAITVTPKPVASSANDLIAPLVAESTREMRLEEEEHDAEATTLNAMSTAEPEQEANLKFDIEFDAAESESPAALQEPPKSKTRRDDPGFPALNVAEQIEQAAVEEGLEQALSDEALEAAHFDEEDASPEDANGTPDDFEGVPQLHTIFLDPDERAKAMEPAERARLRRARYKLWAGSAVLVLTGLLMSAYILRVELARTYPGIRPKLEAACAQIGCTVPFPRDLDLIDRSGVELSPQPGVAGGYVLAITLRNTARYPIAWPQLDLALTDRYDRALTRRVLEPKDWLPKDYLSQPAFEAQGELTAHLVIASTPDVMGYRVGPFYR